MINSFREWLIVKLGGYTETHLIMTEQGIYCGTSKTGLTKAEIDRVLERGK